MASEEELFANTCSLGLTWNIFTKFRRKPS